MTSLICGILKVKYIEAENYQGREGGKIGEMLVKGYKVAVM